MINKSNLAYNSSEVNSMYNTTINNAITNFPSLIRNALNSEEIINIATDEGNVIMLSEQEYRNLILTVEVYQNTPFLKSLINAENEPLEECVDVKDLEWDDV